jgi:hypothetical protein
MPSCRQIARDVPSGISRCRGTGARRSRAGSPRSCASRPRGRSRSRCRTDVARGLVASSSGQPDRDLLGVASADRRLATLISVRSDHLLRRVQQQFACFLERSSARDHGRPFGKLCHRPTVLVRGENCCERQRFGHPLSMPSYDVPVRGHFGTLAHPNILTLELPDSAKSRSSAARSTRVPSREGCWLERSVNRPLPRSAPITQTRSQYASPPRGPRRETPRRIVPAR